MCLLLASGCGNGSSRVSGAEAPATVELDESAGLTRITLSELSGRRLGIETTTVELVADDPAVDQSSVLSIPYSAILYDPDGATAVYISLKSLTFQRYPVEVARIEGDGALLSEGPPAGTRVVTVGAIELLGIESGFGT